MPKVVKPHVYTRGSWGAASDRGCGVYHGKELKDIYNRITVHHDAQDAHPKMNLSESKDRMREHQSLHQNNNDWCDIGYHYCIDTSGKIFAGRSLFSPGAHVERANSGNLGICLFGNFENHSPTVEQVDSLVQLCAWFCQELEIDPTRILGHRDYLSTACPGARMYPVLQNVRKRVEDLL